MRPTTLFLAKFIGVFAILTAGWMMIWREDAIDRIHELVQDRTLSLTWGVFTMAAGLAVVIGHNVWRGGALPVVVTIVGWLILFKGLALMILSPAGWDQALRTLQFEADYYAYLAAPLLVGLYLSAAGFLHRPTHG